jgi:hypothetical protein
LGLAEVTWQEVRIALPNTPRKTERTMKKTAKKISDKLLTRQIKGKLGRARKLDGKIKKLSREKNKLVDQAAKLVVRRDKARRPKPARRGVSRPILEPVLREE